MSFHCTKRFDLRFKLSTAALQMISGANPESGRKPEMVAEAAGHFLTQSSRVTTGNFFIDGDVPSASGITNLSQYAVAL
jgi:citronellol/citronellal dehydrogenase